MVHRKQKQKNNASWRNTSEFCVTGKYSKLCITNKHHKKTPQASHTKWTIWPLGNIKLAVSLSVFMDYMYLLVLQSIIKNEVRLRWEIKIVLFFVSLRSEFGVHILAFSLISMDIHLWKHWFCTYYDTFCGPLFFTASSVFTTWVLN